MIELRNKVENLARCRGDDLTQFGRDLFNKYGVIMTEGYGEFNKLLDNNIFYDFLITEKDIDSVGLLPYAFTKLCTITSDEYLRAYIYVHKHGMPLKFTKDSWKEMCIYDASFMEYAPGHLRKNKEFIAGVCKHNMLAIDYIDEKLRQDHYFVLDVMRSSILCKQTKLENTNENDRKIVDNFIEIFKLINIDESPLL